MNTQDNKNTKNGTTEDRFGILLLDLNDNIFNYVINLLPDTFLFNAYLRTAIARMLGLKLGKSCQIRKNVYFESYKNIKVGTNVFLNRQAYLDAFGGIIIGNNVRFGPRVMIITGSHEVGNSEMRAGEAITGPSIIEDGCWIGANVTIFPGITIGKGSIVSAGSVVQRSMPPNYLISGHPARPIMKLTNEKATDQEA